MKILKWTFISLLSIIVFLLLSGLFLKKEIHVYREISIHENKDTVFNFLRYLKNQELFSVWDKMDPSTKRTYHGYDGEVGFESCWESKMEELGKGCQKIIKIIPGKRAEVLLNFKEPFESENMAYFEVDSVDKNITIVRWGLESKMPYPYNIFNLFYNMEEQIGKDLMIGLGNLKKYMESR
jgi:hypothetical protein